MLRELDIDAVLERRPDLVLVDELAHSNAPGSRHPKRWQDIKELLAAGIDVYTTVNVQHLESLNDVVGQITGVRIAETVPDSVFDEADEVEVVDLPPDDLLQRLKSGKVYMPEQAVHAIANFFRKGNLIALRELALRRTADRVDAQAREYRDDAAIKRVWQLKERLLVAVGPGPHAEQIVRAGRRLAGSLRADWIAIYVETPALQRLPETERARVLRALRLAQELGAETATVPGENVADALIAFAAERNAGKIVLGRSIAPVWIRWLGNSIYDALYARANAVDLLVVGGASDEQKPPPTAAEPERRPTKSNWRDYLDAGIALLIVTALGAFSARTHRHHEHRDALPRRHRVGFRTHRARTRGRGVGRRRCAVRFHLRAAVFRLRRVGHGIRRHVRRDARRRIDDHRTDRGHALSGAHRRASRTPQRGARGDEPRTVRRADCRSDRADRRAARTRRVRSAGRVVAAESRRTPARRARTNRQRRCRNSICRSANGFTTAGSRPGSARTRWPARRSTTCRYARRCAIAACWRCSRATNV